MVDDYGSYSRSRNHSSRGYMYDPVFRVHIPLVGIIVVEGIYIYIYERAAFRVYLAHSLFLISKK